MSFECLVVLYGIPSILEVTLKAVTLAEIDLFHLPIVSGTSVKL